MLDTIALAASDSLLMFFVFNLIVVAVIFGSTPRSGFDQEAEIPLCAAANLYAFTYTSLNQNTDTSKELDIKESPMYDSSDYSGDLGAPSDSDSDSDSSSDDFSSDVDGSGASSDSESSSDDSGEEDDELRRRVEEFIARVNKGWKAELVTTSHVVYTQLS